MAIVKWNPWNISPFFDEDWDMPTLKNQGLNIYETDDSIVAEVALPGIAEDKIDVSIDDGMIHVSATNESKQEEKDKRRYYMSSMAQSYNYSFRLPEGVKEDEEPEATLTNGVLVLNFKKAEPKQPRKIKITAKAQKDSQQKLGNK